MKLLVLVVLIVITAFVWAVNQKLKQSKKDWETLDYLKNKSNNISTLEEIEEFHKEFLEISKNIHNQHITPELIRIDGYLRGMYKIFKNKSL